MVPDPPSNSVYLYNSLPFHYNLPAETSNRYGRQMIVLISEWFRSAKQNSSLSCTKSHANDLNDCLEGQIIHKNIANTSVLVVGAGGLGSPALLYLGASGIGNIGIIDGDKVEISNLHRQIIHTEDLVGVNKAESAKLAIKKLNSSIICESYPYKLNSDNAEELIKNYDIIVDCTDDISTKLLMNEICLKTNKSYVTAAALRHEGQLLVFDRKSYAKAELIDSACYMCIAKTRGIEVKDLCSKFGVLGPVTGVLGCLQSMEVIKIAVGLGKYVGLSPSRMVSYNAFNPINPFKTVQLGKKNPNCPACGKGAEPRFYLELPTDVDNISFNKIPSNSNKAVIIDVRSKPQYTIGHLSNSINWPSDEIIYFISRNGYQQFITELINRSGVREIENIYVVCRRGVESRRVAGELKKVYKTSNMIFYNVEGGLHKYGQGFTDKLPIL